MVNDASTTESGAAGARAAERRLILSYAPAHARAGLSALLQLDDTLADVLRHVSEPVIAQMRLTWWHDALSKPPSRYCARWRRMCCQRA
jgi:15-cis-phytoene synthase